MNTERGMSLYVGIPCVVIGAGMFLRVVFELVTGTSRWSPFELTGIFVVDVLIFAAGIVLLRSTSRK